MQTGPASLRGARGLRLALLLCLALSTVATAGAQAPAAPTPPAPPPTGSVAALLAAVPSEETYTFAYFNRPIIVLKAVVLGRSPTERGEGAVRALDELVAQEITGPVTLQMFEGGVLISVGTRVVLAVTSADIDNLSGETLQGASAQAVARLKVALDEVAEARQPGVLFRHAVLTSLVLILGMAALWVTSRVQRLAIAKMVAAAEQRVAKSSLANAEMLRGLRLEGFERRLLPTARIILNVIIVYAVLAFALREFPYTRPWGESLRGFLFQTMETIGLGIVSALPGLFTVALIFLLTRIVTRFARLWFDAVEAGRITSRWLYPETVQPTRRLLTTLVWLFGVVVAYPYLPGSETEAFKGVSVFLGLLVTLGSSGLVSQIVSGFTITYSRALRVGDFVKIGDVVGTVDHLGVLSTKLRTPWNEEITIPNAVAVAQTTTDYSRLNGTNGVMTPTSVTIGYDSPWRQVHALLLQAAERTTGIRRDPKPLVLQEGLEDFYVRYTLYVCLERQEMRPFTLNVLHANIQDLFNEHGVQIMSPNYVFDPNAPKIVAKKDWFASPAATEDVRSGS